MTYMINARLERGAPLLTLINAATGEERLHWRGGNSANAERDWQGLFKQLILLSCADQISLAQRAKSVAFAEECINCTACVNQEWGDTEPPLTAMEGVARAVNRQ